MSKWWLRIAGGIALVALAIWFLNTSVFELVPDSQQPRLLAHRGVHQIYVGDDRTADTCRANPVAASNHGLIENTIPSMQAAVAAGADVVELDVHLTTDGILAVFHDWTLECLTDGTGVTHQQDFAYLQSLDLGYGYTSDGETFALRGTAGPMPSLRDVLTADLGGQLLINFKSNKAEDAAALDALLRDLPDTTAQVFGAYGGAEPTQAILAARADMRGFDRTTLRSCLIRYAAMGWSGYMPHACRNTLVAVPLDYAPYLWGWPHRFTRRMQAAGSDVILWGPYDGSGFSSGIDDAATLAQVPDHFDGYIWTNRAELIGPLMQ
ncbi:glycerophosphodiester phosphodiesterase family protein [Yoonia sp. 208BN28-4]|uniref:glycerophosphodiester phosphodiesterase family protein n=1 Tax=Yoonia sp. 208BN28-4 TaxID=3126505 RepID=UPI0030B0764F